jgi:hypothetical protein
LKGWSLEIKPTKYDANIQSCVQLPLSSDPLINGLTLIFNLYNATSRKNAYFYTYLNMASALLKIQFSQPFPGPAVDCRPSISSRWLRLPFLQSTDHHEPHQLFLWFHDSFCWPWRDWPWNAMHLAWCSVGGIQRTGSLRPSWAQDSWSSAGSVLNNFSSSWTREQIVYNHETSHRDQPPDISRVRFVRQDAKYT